MITQEPMTPRSRTVSLALVGVLCATIISSAQTSTAPLTSGDAALQAIFDREWEWELTQDPLWASYLGDRRWNDRWPDMTPAAFAARQAHRQGVLKELTTVPAAQ